KGVYEGVKKGDWLGAALSACAGIGALGAAGVKAGAGAVARAAVTVGHVGEAISAIDKTIKAVEKGSISGVITGLGSAAGALASINSLPTNVSAAFTQIKDLADKYGPLVAMGESAYALYKKGDFVG